MPYFGLHPRGFAVPSAYARPHPFGIITFVHCGIVSVPEPGFSPYMLAHIRGPDGEGTFLSRLAAGGRSSSLAL